MSDETRITALEEQVSYLTKTVEELSDIVANQERMLELAERRLGMLMEAEALRQSETDGSMPLADQRPPHW